MKNVFSFIVASLLVTASFAQSDKYSKAMEALVPSIDTTRSYDGLITLANSFERIQMRKKHSGCLFIMRHWLILMLRV